MKTPDPTVVSNALDDEKAAQYQHDARMGDAGVTAILAKAQATGADPAALAAGALHAVVRFHMGQMRPPVTERSVSALILPALSRAIRELLK